MARVLGGRTLDIFCNWLRQPVVGQAEGMKREASEEASRKSRTGSLAYLLSVYPTLEHTYLLREVKYLRSLGWPVQTISVWRPPTDRPALSAVEENEIQSTWYVLDEGVCTHLVAHLATMVRRPRSYLGGLVTALKFGQRGPRKTLLAIAHFCEAICAGFLMEKAGIEYLHCVYATTVGVIISRVFDINLSIAVHGSAEFVDPEGFALREKVRLSQFCRTISYFGKSQVLLWSSPSDWDKVLVISLGVDPGEWEPGKFRESPECFELISIGRLVEGKGYRLLFEVVARLRRDGENLHLTLVGDGPAKACLEKEIDRLELRNAVTLVGWNSQADLGRRLANSDICVLASFAEGVPVVLMEAMALGIPCVAPEIAGIPELIRSGRDGILYTVANGHELKCAIAQLMSSHELRRRMSESSRQRVVEKYNLARNTSDLAEVFRAWMHTPHQSASKAGIEDKVPSNLPS